MAEPNPPREVIEELTTKIETSRGPESPENREDLVEGDEESAMGTTQQEEEVRSPMRVANEGQGFIDEEGLQQQKTCTCKASFMDFVRFVYNFGRSVPIWTMFWAAVSVYSVIRAFNNLQSIGKSFHELLPFSTVFRYVNFAAYYIYAINSIVVVLSVLFTGWTLETLIQKHCIYKGVRGFCQRFSFRSAQGVFFPLAYIGFLSLLAALLSSVVLGALTLLANQACSGKSVPEAASLLSVQVSKALRWLFLPSATVDPAGLANYCRGDGLALDVWRSTFIFFGAALVAQVNLTMATWTMILKTGFEISRQDMKREQTIRMEKYRLQPIDEEEVSVSTSSRPTSRRLSVDLAPKSRPVSMRANVNETKEADETV